MAAARAGQTCRQVAATFKVSVASVVKWSQRFAGDRQALTPAQGAVFSRRRGIG